MQLDLLYFLVWLFSSIRIICPLPYRHAVRQIIPCVLPFSSNALQLIQKKKKAVSATVAYVTILF